MIVNMAVAGLTGGAILVSLASAAVLARYAERSIAWSSFLVAVVGFTLSFSIVGLIPYDVWGSLMLADQAKKKPGFQAPSHLMVRETWAAIYWTTTVVCYLIIPFLMEFDAAGEFFFVARLRKSLRNNLVWYLVYLVIGICAVVYLLMKGLELHNIGAWCVAASNAWGLILLTVLMGFGLVALPRQLWNLGSPSAQLRVLYPLATSRDEARKSAQYELQGAIAEARREVESCDVEQDDGLKWAYETLRRTLESSERLQREISGMSEESVGIGGGSSSTSDASKASPEPRVMGLQSSAAASNNGGVDSEIVLRRLVKLHSSLKTTSLEARRSACQFEQLVVSCLRYEELEDEREPRAMELLSEIPADGCRSRCRHALCRCRVIRDCWRRLESLWVRKLRNKLFRYTAVICGLLSSIIVLGQLTMFWKSVNLSALSILFLADHGPVLTQVLCAVPLGYMTCTAYWSVFRLKIAGWYGLYSKHNTDAGSLLWCSYSLARLALPLCYHFLLLVDRPPHLQTSFQDFMGQIKFVPILGHELNEVFPCLVAVVVFCNITKVYSRIVGCLGLDILQFEVAPSAESEDPHSEGKELIERERRRRDEETAMELQRQSEGLAGSDGAAMGLAGSIPLWGSGSRAPVD